MSNMTYSWNPRISAFLSVQRIKRERKRNKKKKRKKHRNGISSPLRCAAVSQSSAVSRADAWIKLYYCGGGPAGKNGVIGRRKLCGNRLKSLKSRGLR